MRAGLAVVAGPIAARVAPAAQADRSGWHTAATGRLAYPAADPTVVVLVGERRTAAGPTGGHLADLAGARHRWAGPTVVRAGLAAAADPTEAQGQAAEQVLGERTTVPTAGEQEHIPAARSGLPAVVAEAGPTVAAQRRVAGQEVARSSVAGFAWSAAGAEAVPIVVAAVAAWGLRRIAVAAPTAAGLARAAARPSACNRAEAAVRTALVPERAQARVPAAGPVAWAQAGTAEAAWARELAEAEPEAVPRALAQVAESKAAVLVPLPVPDWKRAPNRPEPEVRAALVQPRRVLLREQSLRPAQLLLQVQPLLPVWPRRPRPAVPEKPLPARSSQAVRILQLVPAHRLAR